MKLLESYVLIEISNIWTTQLPGRGRAIKVNKGAKINDRYKQVPHLTQDTHGKVTYSQVDTKNESQEVSPFQAGDHKAIINRLARRHNKHKTEKYINDPQKEYRPGTVSKHFTGGLQPV